MSKPEVNLCTFSPYPFCPRVEFLPFPLSGSVWNQSAGIAFFLRFTAGFIIFSPEARRHHCKHSAGNDVTPLPRHTPHPPFPEIIQTPNHLLALLHEAKAASENRPTEKVGVAENEKKMMKKKVPVVAVLRSSQLIWKASR